jgi:hypothetical protein
LSKPQYAFKESTLRVKPSRRPTTTAKRFVVTSDGEGIANHAGSFALRELSDRIGLTRSLSVSLQPHRTRQSPHDPGQVLRDLIVMLADGGDCLSDLSALRDQPELFGAVASTATAWRLITSLTEADLDRIRAARRVARETAWRGRPAPQTILLDLDSTLVTSHSEKEHAAPNFKRGFGFHPVLCYVDDLEDAVAGKLRPGNAVANNTADNIEVLERALQQLPDSKRQREILVRGDSALATHDFVAKVRALGLKFSIGLDLYGYVREAILNMNERAWVPAIDAEGEPREGAAVCELTGLDLSAWPAGTRAICRRERPHPGAQLTFTDANGYRFQVVITDQADADLAQLELRHRAHAHVENRIRSAKDTGLENFPFHDFLPNQVWLELVLAAQDLVAFFHRLCLRGEARSWEPKSLRYRLFHTAARVVHSGRRLILRLQRTWPWTRLLDQAFNRLRRIAFVT